MADEDGFTEPLPKLGAPAERALASAGVKCLEDVASLRKSDLRAMHAVGDHAIERQRVVLEAAGLAFADG